MVRQLLGELHDLSPVPVHIRAHHLLTSGNGVPELKWSSTNVFSLDANGKPVYDFRILDGIFDEYKAAGVRPMVELGFMPKDLAANPEPIPGALSEGHDLGRHRRIRRRITRCGARLVRKVTEHLVQRYGREEVLQWYFEVWNEPNIPYWHGTPEQYYKLYDYAVAGVRAALPGAMVGGPASTGPGSAQAATFLENFLKHVDSGKSAATGGKVPMDFISFHVKGQPKVIDGHVRMGLDKELNDAEKGFAIIAKYPRLAHLPVILSEADPEGCAACSAKVRPSNNYRNGTLYPVYTAAAIKELFALQDRYKINLIAMLSWSFEFEGKDYFEGFRSLSTNGIDKPVLNVFRMAGLMSGERVETTSTGQISLDDILKSGVRQAPDIDALATRGTRQAAVMMWNYQDDDLPAAGIASTGGGLRYSCRGAQGSAGALSHRSGPQQCLHGMEGDGVAAESYAGAVCEAEGCGAATVARCAAVADGRGWQGRNLDIAAAAGYIADAFELVRAAIKSIRNGI